MNALPRRAAAVFLGLHGLVHLMGFAAAWQLATLSEIAYRRTVFNGALEVGDAGTRLLGIGWLVVAPAFLVAAYGLWRARPWALPVTVVVAAVSLAICVLGLPDAYRGVAIDVGVLVAVAVAAFVRPARIAGVAR